MNINSKIIERLFRSFFYLFLSLIGYTSCSKDFLDLKPDKQMVVPSKLKDFRAILDNTMKMNISMPYFVETSADDQYITYNSYITLSSEEAKLAYIWQSTPYYNNNESLNWNSRYEQIFYCNIVLDGLEKIEILNNVELQEKNEIQGSALFFRAWAYWQLSQLFCDPYKVNSSNSGLGLPLRLTSSINDLTKRSTVDETWNQIIDDLNKSILLLPVKSDWKTRPTLPAAYSFLSRIYLAMGNYEKSSEMSDKSLKIYDLLIDFANVDPNRNYTMNRFNEEVLFHSVMSSTVTIRETRLNVDSNLYNSYEDDDYRKSIYFYSNNGIRFKGSYNGDRDFFCGLTTTETLLNYIESEVRLGNINSSIKNMEKLLSLRYSSMNFNQKLVTDPQDLLAYILEERRKELIFKGIRWTDLRRLNQDARFAKTLIRKLDKEYILEPNSPNYTFPIPQSVLDKSGIEQN